MVDSYINSKISDIDCKIKKIGKSRNRVDTLTSLTTVFFGAFGVCVLLGAPALSIPSISVAILTGYGCYLNKHIKDRSIFILEKEKSKLEKLKSESPENNDAANKNRKNKQVQCKKKISKFKSICRGSKLALGISGLVTVCGAAASIFATPLAIVAGAGLVGSYISGKIYNKNKGKCDSSVYIENSLNHESQIINLTKKPIKNNNVNQANNADQSNNANSINQIIDKYINNLEKQNNPENGKYQRVKK